MRHLIDTYIEADEPRKISPFDNMSLIDLIVKTGIADAIATRLENMKGNKDAVAETIENNVRSKIIQEHLNDPAYYEKMSELLDEIIAARKAKAIEYEEYLKRIAELLGYCAVGCPSIASRARRTAASGDSARASEPSRARGIAASSSSPSCSKISDARL
jgi:type I restriction enzyme R subunit